MGCSRTGQLDINGHVMKEQKLVKAEIKETRSVTMNIFEKKIFSF